VPTAYCPAVAIKTALSSAHNSARHILRQTQLSTVCHDEGSQSKLQYFWNLQRWWESRMYDHLQRHQQPGSLALNHLSTVVSSIADTHCRATTGAPATTDLPLATRVHTTTPICKRFTSWRQSPISYSNETLTSVHRRDGSCFYSNLNGSTYYNNGRGNAVYKPGNQGSY